MHTDLEKQRKVLKKREKVTLGSSPMAEMRSERRSKQRRASGGCWAAEATMDSNCATSTLNRERGTFSLTYFFAISTTTKTKCYKEKQRLLCRRRRFKIQDWGERFGVKKEKKKMIVVQCERNELEEIRNWSVFQGLGLCMRLNVKVVILRRPRNFLGKVRVGKGPRKCWFSL